MSTDDEIKAAAGKVSDAIKAFLDSDADLPSTDAVCTALEQLCDKMGAESLSVAKLRRKLKRYGLTGDKAP